MLNIAQTLAYIYKLYINVLRVSKLCISNTSSSF